MHNLFSKTNVFVESIFSLFTNEFYTQKATLNEVAILYLTTKRLQDAE